MFNEYKALKDNGKKKKSLVEKSRSSFITVSWQMDVYSCS